MSIKITGREHLSKILEDTGIRKVDMFESMGITSAYFFRIMNDPILFKQNLRAITLALKLIRLRKTFGFIDLLVGTDGIPREEYVEKLSRASSLSPKFKYCLIEVKSNKFTFSDGNMKFDLFVLPESGEIWSKEYSETASDCYPICKMTSSIGIPKYVFADIKLSNFLDFFYYEVGGQVFINTKTFT